MKLHMISVYYKGRRITWFALFPEGIKPHVTDLDLKRIGVRQGDCFGVG